jgi:hypothetical protein
MRTCTNRCAFFSIQEKAPKKFRISNSLTTIIVIYK